MRTGKSATKEAGLDMYLKTTDQQVNYAGTLLIGSISTLLKGVNKPLYMELCQITLTVVFHKAHAFGPSPFVVYKSALSNIIEKHLPDMLCFADDA